MLKFNQPELIAFAVVCCPQSSVRKKEYLDMAVSKAMSQSAAYLVL